MNCQQIEEIINELKVNSLGSIRGKNRAIDKIHYLHLKEIRDNEYVNRSLIKKKLRAKIESLEKEGLLKSIDESVIIGIKMAYSLI